MKWNIKWLVSTIYKQHTNFVIAFDMTVTGEISSHYPTFFGQHQERRLRFSEYVLSVHDRLSPKQLWTESSLNLRTTIGSPWTATFRSDSWCWPKWKRALITTMGKMIIVPDLTLPTKKQQLFTSQTFFLVPILRWGWFGIPQVSRSSYDLLPYCLHAFIDLNKVQKQIFCSRWIIEKCDLFLWIPRV